MQCAFQYPFMTIERLILLLCQSYERGINRSVLMDRRIRKNGEIRIKLNDILFSSILYKMKQMRQEMVFMEN